MGLLCSHHVWCTNWCIYDSIPRTYWFFLSVFWVSSLSDAAYWCWLQVCTFMIAIVYLVMLSLHPKTHTVVHCGKPLSQCVPVPERLLCRGSFHRLHISGERIVFPPQPILLCCGWRLESWPNVLRMVSISRWHLAANNKSMWGLHLKPLSHPVVFPYFTILSLSMGSGSL